MKPKRNANSAHHIVEKVPKIMPFADWDYFYIDEDFSLQLHVDTDCLKVRVPKGFVTDLASSPRVMWSLVPRIGRYAYPAILHDYLYWKQDFTRAESDRIFKVAMTVFGVPWLVLSTLYKAVRLGGESAWEQNSLLHGQRRILRRFPDCPLITWDSWRQRPGVFADDTPRSAAPSGGVKPEFGLVG